MQKEKQEKSAAIKVFVRVRPLIEHEIDSEEIVTVNEDCKTVNVDTNSISKIQIKFDQAIPKDSSQKEVFQLFEEYIPKVPEGYNMTIFAYGQTGSGKTYTMFGSDWENSIENTLQQKYQKTFFEDLASDENFAGLIPRSIYALFGEISNYKQAKKGNFNVYCSFLQIYNERIYDLLQDFAKPKALNLHESKFDGIFVQGLSQYAVTHYIDCLELMKKGQKNRFIRQTSMNTKSSRSHTIFQILLQSTQPDSSGNFKKVRLNLCDLAGSEKVNKSQDMTSEHFKELRNINQSLSTLGKVIASLSSQKTKLAPFRQSKLTRLLQDSLTSNITFVVGNISPSDRNMEETINTLKFVERARHIVMKVKPMQYNGQNTEVVSKLQKQIQYLRELLNMKRKGMSPDDIHKRLMSLQTENQKLKKSTVSMQDVEKLIKENRQMKIEIQKLQTMQNDVSDGGDSKSDFSVPNRGSHIDQLEFKVKQGSKGFELPYEPKRTSPRSQVNQTPRKALRESAVYNQTTSSRNGGKKNQKQKIIDRLSELQKIQKSNQIKLMKDLEQVEKKSLPKSNSTLSQSSFVKKKVPPSRQSDIKKAPPSSHSDKKSGVSYEDKIKELESKLFGK